MTQMASVLAVATVLLAYKLILWSNKLGPGGLAIIVLGAQTDYFTIGIAHAR